MLAFGVSQTVYVNNNEQVRLVPKLLNYQGYLTDTLGIPVTDPSLSMAFAIFDDPSAGTLFWNETQSSINVSKGIFHVLLGGVTPIPDSVFNDRNERWLELTVAGQTLSPRTRIVSMPYAYNATYADTASYARASNIDVVWSFCITDGADTTLQTDGKWGLSRAGNAMFGNADSTHVNFGVGCTTGTSGLNYKYATVGGGIGNTASGLRATVGGGYSNAASQNATTIGGGFSNLADSNFATVGGGYDNTASGYSSVVSGGCYNAIRDNYGVICGGVRDTVKAPYGAVLGGYSNLSGDSPDDTAAVVVGGMNNSGTGRYAFVGGGLNNGVTGRYAVVAGGNANYVYGIYGGVLSGYSNLGGTAGPDTGATVCGGYDNNADARYSFVGGGFQNAATADYSTIAGGYSGVAGYYATIGGGDDNDASGNYSVVAGGNGNSATGPAATVAGGSNNEANGFYATVCGGYNNHADTNYATVGGGSGNSANGNCSTIGGGYSNVADTTYSTVAGGIDNDARGRQSAIGGGSNNSTDSSSSTVCGGWSNHAGHAYATVAGGWMNGAYAYSSFATNYSTEVQSGDDCSAAFNTCHTTGSDQVRGQAFVSGSVNFVMDHPDDPMNKLLNQYAIGSDELMLMYSGAIVLDDNGKAVVNLPDYFDDINRNPRIQLTGVGSPDVVYVAEKIKNNRFVIGGKAGMEVYWTVVAERTDIHAEIARILTPVVQEKKGDLRGHSIDDDAMIGIYDRIKPENPELFVFKTEEGSRVHEQAKQLIKDNE
jgi:hypothetical protein